MILTERLRLQRCNKESVQSYLVFRPKGSTPTPCSLSLYQRMTLSKAGGRGCKGCPAGCARPLKAKPNTPSKSEDGKGAPTWKTCRGTRCDGRPQPLQPLQLPLPPQRAPSPQSRCQRSAGPLQGSLCRSLPGTGANHGTTRVWESGTAGFSLMVAPGISGRIYP